MKDHLKELFKAGNDLEKKKLASKRVNKLFSQMNLSGKSTPTADITNLDTFENKKSEISSLERRLLRQLFNKFLTIDEYSPQGMINLKMCSLAFPKKVNKYTFRRLAMLSQSDVYAWFVEYKY